MNEENDSKFVTRKWNIGNDNSGTNYDEGSKIIYNTGILKSILCNIRHQSTQVAVKNCPLFTRCITKIDGTTTDDAEVLHPNVQFNRT